MPTDGIVAGPDGKLVDGAVAAEDLPTGAANPAANLGKPLAAVEGLIVLARGVAEAGVELVKPHEVEVVGSGEEEPRAGLGDAVHGEEGGVYVGDVLDGFAGEDEVERSGGEGELLGVALDESDGREGRLGWRRPTEQAVACGVQGGRGKIAGGDVRAGERKAARKAAAAASNFEDAQAGDVADVLGDELVPGTGSVVVIGASVVDAVVPEVVIGAQGHGGR